MINKNNWLIFFFNFSYEGMPTAIAYQTNPGGYYQVPTATVDTPAYTQQHTGESTPPPQYQEKA